MISLTFNMSLNSWKVCLGKLFVITSANIWSVLQYFTLMDLSLTFCLIKWYATSICFVRLWNLGFLDNSMAPWLSSFIIDGWSCFSPISLSNLRSHTTSCVAWLKATYSAAVLDLATQDCLLLLQLTVDPLIWKTYPDVDFLVSTSFAQSASE